jgi:hypothetical protein
MGRRPLSDEPATVNRHANPCRGRGLMNFETSGDLFQRYPPHRAVGGYPVDVGDDMAGKRFIVMHVG